jgi:hypothetical protein
MTTRRKSARTASDCASTAHLCFPIQLLDLCLVVCFICTSLCSSLLFACLRSSILLSRELIALRKGQNSKGIRGPNTTLDVIECGMAHTLKRIRCWTRGLMVALVCLACQCHLHSSVRDEAVAFSTQPIALVVELPRSSFSYFTVLQERRCDATWGCCIQICALERKEGSSHLLRQRSQSWTSTCLACG